MEAIKTEPKKSWRDVYKVHPAADLFPMLPEDELRKLGEDIAANGLRESISLFRADDDVNAERISILDGRNRLAAMEMLGLIDPEWPQTGTSPSVRWIRSNPESYVVSANIRRRHLTKEQQADLIVKVMTTSTDFAKVARSVQRSSNGQVQGTVKDPFKEKVVEEARKHGISKRTTENAIAKAKGPTQSQRKAAEPTTQEEAASRAGAIKCRFRRSPRRPIADRMILILDSFDNVVELLGRFLDEDEATANDDHAEWLNHIAKNRTEISRIINKHGRQEHGGL